MSEYLPQDIVTKILSRLPPKPLIKFRCVSKSWRQLISSPHFIELHKQHTALLLSASAATSPRQFLIRRYSKSLNTEAYSVHIDGDNDDKLPDAGVKIEFPFRNLVRFYYRIVGSCNGVVCLIDDQFGRPVAAAAAAVQLWNPLIRRKLMLPPPPSSIGEDSSKKLIVLGFGFDSRSGDHKVVRIAYVQIRDWEYRLPPIVEVYTVSSGNWHAIGGEIPKNFVVEYYWSQVFIHGKVHWVAYRNLGGNDKLQILFMLFDIEREVFDEMRLPEALESELAFNLAALDLGGALAVVHYSEHEWVREFRIWVMKDYADVESWSLGYKYEIGLIGGIGRVVGIRRNGDVLMTSTGGVLVAWGRGRHKVLGVSSGTKESFPVGPYHESLALFLEGSVARERVASDGDGDEEGRVEDVEKSEIRMHSGMTEHLTAMIRRP